MAILLNSLQLTTSMYLVYITLFHELNFVIAILKLFFGIFLIKGNFLKNTKSHTAMKGIVARVQNAFIGWVLWKTT